MTGTRADRPAVSTAPPQRARFAPEDRVWVSAGLFGALAVTLAVPLALLAMWSVTERWTPPHLLPEATTTAVWATADCCRPH
jgi:ABC-type uncharacterized transport system YnjBCD permease subunit